MRVAHLLLEDRGQEPPKRRVDLVERLAIHLEDRVELLHAHLPKHRVAGALGSVDDRLVAQIDLGEQLGRRVEVAEEEVVPVKEACVGCEEARMDAGQRGVWQQAAGRVATRGVVELVEW